MDGAVIGNLQEPGFPRRINVGIELDPARENIRWVRRLIAAMADSGAPYFDIPAFALGIEL
ncbi:hypothetical protein NMD1_03532 [Novosphingobium sp. MD-1]|nr:hypothetical protein NMD1_03532 [Novosphingobium sp. MD-1]